MRDLLSHQSELADRLMEYLVYVRMAIDNIEAAPASTEPFTTMIRTLVQHEAALLCDQSNWDRLNVMIEVGWQLFRLTNRTCAPRLSRRWPAMWISAATPACL